MLVLTVANERVSERVGEHGRASHGIFFIASRDSGFPLVGDWRENSTSCVRWRGALLPCTVQYSTVPRQLTMNVDMLLVYILSSHIDMLRNPNKTGNLSSGKPQRSVESS